MNQHNKSKRSVAACVSQTCWASTARSQQKQGPSASVGPPVPPCEHGRCTEHELLPASTDVNFSASRTECGYRTEGQGAAHFNASFVEAVS